MAIRIIKQKILPQDKGNIEKLFGGMLDGYISKGKIGLSVALRKRMANST